MGANISRRGVIAGASMAGVVASMPAIAKAGPGGFSSDGLKAVTGSMQAAIDRGDAAGVVTLLYRHGEIAQVDAVGYQDEAAKTPMRRDTIFRIASMTKPITAVATLMLIEEGKFGLSTPVEKILPEGDPLFDEDMLTDRAERWFVTEFVREQIFLLTKREVPYSVAVTVDEFEEKPGKQGREIRIAATISVDKEAHKRIVVGEGGRMIREIGSRARFELGKRFEATVHLSLFVRVDEGWTQSPHKLRELGYEA